MHQFALHALVVDVERGAAGDGGAAVGRAQRAAAAGDQQAGADRYGTGESIGGPEGQRTRALLGNTGRSAEVARTGQGVSVDTVAEDDVARFHGDVQRDVWIRAGIIEQDGVALEVEVLGVELVDPILSDIYVPGGTQLPGPAERVRTAGNSQVHLLGNTGVETERETAGIGHGQRVEQFAGIIGQPVGAHRQAAG